MQLASLDRKDGRLLKVSMTTALKFRREGVAGGGLSSLSSCVSLLDNLYELYVHNHKICVSLFVFFQIIIICIIFINEYYKIRKML